MEKYELTITSEEARNYHNVLFQLKALTLNGWIRAYIMTVISIVALCFCLFTISKETALAFFMNTGWYIKLIFILVVFILLALQRSKNQQLKEMLQKYFLTNIPQEFLSGGIILKKIKVQDDKLVVYYRKKTMR